MVPTDARERTEQDVDGLARLESGRAHDEHVVAGALGHVTGIGVDTHRDGARQLEDPIGSHAELVREPRRRRADRDHEIGAAQRVALDHEDEAGQEAVPAAGQPVARRVDVHPQDQRCGGRPVTRSANAAPAVYQPPFPSSTPRRG